MEILHFGLASDQETYKERISRNQAPYIVAQQTFETAMNLELLNHNEINLTWVYIPQELGYFTSKILFMKSKAVMVGEKTAIEHLPLVNLPIIKFIILFAFSTLKICKFIFNKKYKHDKLIVISVNYLPVSFAIHLCSTLFRIKTICLITDTTAFLTMKERSRNISILKKIMIPLYLKLISISEGLFDGFVLFSKHMAEIVNVKDKKYLIMEGMISMSENIPIDKKYDRKNSVMYAGSLFPQYGISTLIEAFTQINDNNLELWIFGDGESKEYIKNMAQKDERIIYYGFKDRNTVLGYEKEASLLILTRSPTDTYTRMSFPSKLMEYMLTGTPVMTTRIDGIPEEYFKYLNVVEDPSIDGIKSSIINFFLIPEKIRLENGQNAKKFIESNKNATLQVNNILNLYTNILKKGS